MTVPTIYTFPDINPIGFTWSIETSKKVSQNDFTGIKEQSSLLSHRWRCQITMGSLSEVDTLRVIAFLSRMADESALFKIFDYKTRNPLGSIKTVYDGLTPKPTIFNYSGNDSMGNLLITWGWGDETVSYKDTVALYPGDCIGFIGTDGLYSKHIVTAGVTNTFLVEETNCYFRVNGMDTATLVAMKVSPPLRESPVHNTAIIVNDVPVVMQVNPETVASWSTRGYVYEDQVIDCFEYIP